MNSRFLSPRMLAGACLLASFVSTATTAEINRRPPNEPPRSDYASLVKRLGDAKYGERCRAMQQLSQVREEAIPEIVAGLNSSDFEIQHRCLALLEKLSCCEEETIATRVEQTLQAELTHVSQAARPVMDQALESWQERRRELALADLQQWGADIRIDAQGRGTSITLGSNWRGGDERLNLLERVGDVRALSIINAQLDSAFLARLPRLAELKTLYIDGTRFDTRHLEQLARWPRLEQVALLNIQLSSEGLRPLPSLTQLISLRTENTNVTDDDLQYLQRLPSLQILWLDGSRISHAGLTYLRPLRNLQLLQLSNTSVSGEGLAALRDLPLLTSLSLKGVQLTPADIGRLGELRNLETLGLDHTNVTDEHLRQLRPLPRLQTLWLSRAAVTDESMERLGSCPDLKTVYLHASLVTARGEEKLKGLVPNCQVFR